MNKYFHWCALCLLLCGTVFLSSCNVTQEVTYFQDLKPGVSQITLSEAPGITIQPEDQISIIVSSRDPQLASLFNLPNVSYSTDQISQSNNGGSNNRRSQGLLSYTVDAQGNIDFPVLGVIHVAGKSRKAIEAEIKNLLLQKNLIKDPIVTVEYKNLNVTVMGEVNRPGRYSIDRDHLTLLDALGMAGDLTIYGKRDKVKVLREENGVQHVYNVNLCSGEQVYTSPAYYLRQNDVVYVEPNNMRARQSTVNGNTVRTASFWLSLASFLTSISVLIFN